MCVALPACFTEGKRPQRRPVRFQNDPQLVRALYVFWDRQFRLKHCLAQRNWSKKQPRWDGGKHKGQNYTPIWPQIAEFLHTQKLPTCEFIVAKFRICSRTPPPPSTLLNLDGIPSLRQSLEAQLDEAELQLRLHISVWEKTQDDMYFGSLLKEYENCPLFGYCVGRIQRKQVLIDDFFNAAATQYYIQPNIYDAQWFEVLPADFLQLAADFIGIPLAD